MCLHQHFHRLPLQVTMVTGVVYRMVVGVVGLLFLSRATQGCYSLQHMSEFKEHEFMST